MRTRFFLLGCALAVIVTAPVHAAIDSLWSSPATTGGKGALYVPGTDRVAYFYALDSAAGVCRIYDADNLTQVYTPSMSSGTYTYLWNYYIPDADGNGHPEVIAYNYSIATTCYSTKIIDASSSAVLKSWSRASYSYMPKFVAATPGSATLKLGIEKSNGMAGAFPSRQLVYSLGVSSAVSGPAPVAPGTSGITLEQSFPNPSSNQAVIEFALPSAGHTRLVVYNQLGQQVATMADGPLEAGKHRIPFDGHNLASGAYFYRLTTADGAEVKKLLLVK